MPRPRDDFDDDDDFDRPRRRRDEESDDFDDPPVRRPKRKRRKPAGPPAGLIIGLVVGIGLFGAVSIGLVVYLLLPASKSAPVARTAAPVSPSAAPAPAAKPAPAPANQQVTITAVRRGTGFAGKPTLQIDYTLTGGFVPGHVVVMIKGPRGTGEATIFGGLGIHPGSQSGTWTIEKFMFGDGFTGRHEVWVEQKMGFAGGIVSNTFVLD